MNAFLPTSLRGFQGLVIASASAALITFLSACGSTVASGGTGGSGATSGGAGGGSQSTTSGNGGSTSTTSGNGGSTSTTSGGGGAGPAGEAIAMLYSQFPQDPSGSSGQTSSASGGGIDPNTLYIFLGDFPIACDDPFKSACPSWHISVGIPPALQAPGVIQLNNPALISSFSISESPDSNGECTAGGGGSFWDGTIEIVSIDAMSVDFKLAGTSTSDFDANGEFTAERCP